MLRLRHREIDQGLHHRRDCPPDEEHLRSARQHKAEAEASRAHAKKLREKLLLQRQKEAAASREVASSLASAGLMVTAAAAVAAFAAACE